MLLVVRLSARDAIIRPDKLRDYLLSEGHPDGRGKAEYLGRLGYSQDAFGSLMRTFASRFCLVTLNPGGRRATGRSMRCSDH